MKIMKSMNGKYKTYVILLIAIAAISLDLATSKKYKSEEGTFRYESDFDAVTAATTTVAIVPSDYAELNNPVSRDIDPSYDQIEEMVREAIELQGGLDWVIDPGDKVMLKVNLVGGNSPSGEGENTDVRVVKALIRVIAEHTDGDVEIVVAEGTARVNDDVDDPSSVWGNSGYRDLLTDPLLTGINFRLFNLNQSYANLLQVSLGNKATAAPHNGSYYIHREELEADVFIVVPVLKIHDTGITNALKNQIGTAPGAYYGYNKTKGSAYYGGLVHDVDHRRWTTEEIVDLCTCADIDFVVVDAIMCLESYKAYSGNNQVRFNTIFAGADPVAVDHVAAKLMGLNPDDVAHITLAEKIGLGTNNPEHIEVTGASIAETMKRVKQNTSENGKFGQSNRTWLLSTAYNSTDITEEFIGNESHFEPVAEENGWSEPVYFFDDRIDLLSYYQNAEDIVSYAFTYFSAPADQEAELWLGSHEAIIVYINGEVVHSFSGINAFGDGDLWTNEVPIDINEGENTLLVKTLNQFGDYSFCLNICEPESNSIWEGNRVEGLKFYTTSTDTSGSGGEVTLPALLTEDPINLRIWPNPSSGPVHIAFHLNDPSPVNVAVFDLQGKRIIPISNEELSAGNHEFEWNPGVNGTISAGTYFLSLETDEIRLSRKIVIKK